MGISCVIDVIFNDRKHAGHALAQQLSSYKKENPLILGLARGGSLVAKSIAEDMSLSFDVLVVKKIPSPQNPELGIGALAPDNVSYVDWKFAQRMGVDEDFVNKKIRNLAIDIKERMYIYRKGRKPIRPQDNTIILTDDGVATGGTIQAAILWLRKKHAKKIIVALPVVPLELTATIQRKADAVVVLETPSDFSAVGQFYKDFHEVDDEEVVELLCKRDTNIRMHANDTNKDKERIIYS